MKKIFYIAGVCAALASQTACSPQFEDLFDKTATERLEETMDDARAVLAAADKGWAMGYFPNTMERGYVLFAKFEADGQVTLTDYNNGGLTYTSTYSMNISQGPVLNFDTYSEVLAEYVDPGTWQGGATGNQGDFEFVIFEVAEDKVLLKGKKYGAKVMLNKIVGDGDAATLYQTYFDASNDVIDKFFVKGISPVLTVDNVSYLTLTNASSRVFEVFPYGSTNEEEMSMLSFITTLDGVDLAADQTINGKTFRSFVYDEAQGALVSREDAAVRIEAPGVYDVLRTSGLVFAADKDGVSGTFKPGFDALAAGFEEKYSGKRNLASVGLTAKEGKPVFVISTEKNTALYTLPGEWKEDKLVIDAFDAASFPESSMDNNAKVFYNGIAAVKSFLALLPGEYTLTNTSGLSVATVDMVSVADAANKLSLERK